MFSIVMIVTIPIGRSFPAEGEMTNAETDTYPVFIERSELEMSSGHTVDITIYYPGYNRLIEKQTRDREAPFPLVIFSPGAGGGGVLQYGTYVSELASYGFIVAGVSWEYEDNREMDVAHIDHTDVIDHLGELSDTRTSPLNGLIDTNNCGAYGHSRGGRAAFMASDVDSRIKSVSAWMPTLNNGSDVDQSSNKLLFAGEHDIIAYPPIWTDPLYETCEPLMVYVNVTEGDHSPVKEIHADITFKFFRYHLRGETSLEPEVYGDEIKQRAKSGEFHLRIKTYEGEYDSEMMNEVIPEENEQPEEEVTEEDSEEEVEEKPEEKPEEDTNTDYPDDDHLHNQNESIEMTENEMENHENENEDNQNGDQEFIIIVVIIGFIVLIVMIIFFTIIRRRNIIQK